MDSLLTRHQAVFGYLSEVLPDAPVFDWILAETARRGIPEIQITSVQGRLLRQLARLIGARRIVEIGTLSGYSTVWLAQALPADGQLITVEINAKHAQLARESLAQAGLSDRSQVLIGPALEVLASRAWPDPLDMVFIDADKQNNLAYFRWSIEHVRPGGLIVVDNVFMNARVATHPERPVMAAIRELNSHVAEHYADWASFVPAYKEDEDNLDGLLIVQAPR